MCSAICGVRRGWSTRTGLLHHLEAVLAHVALGALVVPRKSVEVATVDVAAVDAEHGLAVRLGDAATAEAAEECLSGDGPATGDAHRARGGLHGGAAKGDGAGRNTWLSANEGEHLVSLDYRRGGRGDGTRTTRVEFEFARGVSRAWDAARACVTAAALGQPTASRLSSKFYPSVFLAARDEIRAFS